MTTTSRATHDNTDNKPTHIAFVTREIKGSERSSIWTPCGAAWAHKDGKGFRIKLDAVPVNGVIELRLNDAKAANDGNPSSMWDDMPDGEAY